MKPAQFVHFPVSSFQFPVSFRLQIFKSKILKLIGNWKLVIDNFRAKRRGFTLIELLVAISIIGILATLALANFNAARARARDAQRKADLRQIQNALRVYYNDKGSYPTHNATNYTINGCGASGTSECPWASSWTAGTQTYMSTLPRDPAPNFSYRYVRVDADNYSLKACFENRSDDKCSPTAEGWCNTTLNGCVYEAKP